MGRHLKRVAMDFDWPRSKTWVGYVNPYRGVDCPYCEGRGLSPEARALSDTWYRGPQGEKGWSTALEQPEVDALLAAGRLMDFTHVPRTEAQREIVRVKVAQGGNSWLPESNGYVPTADEVNAWAARAGVFGHDSINRGVCVEARAKRRGFPHLCAHCAGDGVVWFSPEVKRLSNEWEPQDPPVGEGYQLWEDTSEGSPVSPVFPTLPELCTWLAANAGYCGVEFTADKWQSMLETDTVHIQIGNATIL